MPRTSEIARKNTRAELYRTRHDVSSVLKLTKYIKRTVYRLVAKFRNGSSVEWKTHNLRSDKKQTPCFLSGLKQSIEANPIKSVAKLAKSWNVIKITISKVVQKDLKMKSYCRQRRCILTAKLKTIRTERSLLLLNHWKNRRGNVRIFVNEKRNYHNSQVIAKGHKEVFTEMKSKHPALVLVFLAVVSDSRIMPPHFIKAWTKINTSVYVKMLKKVLMPQIKKHSNQERIMFI